MRKLGIGRPSPAMAVAFVALFAALAGGAFAAKKATKKAPRNSVVSRSIKNGQVKSADIANRGVKTADLGPASVDASKLADDSVDGSKVAGNAIGASELGDLTTVTATSGPSSDADGTTNGGKVNVVKVTATCPTGTQLVFGGSRWVESSNGTNDDENVYVQEAYRDGDSWTVEGVIDYGAQGSLRLQAEAYCL